MNRGLSHGKEILYCLTYLHIDVKIVTEYCLEGDFFGNKKYQSNKRKR